MKHVFAFFALSLSFTLAYAEALTSGAAGRDDAESCNNAKAKVQRMIEEKGQTVGKFSNCDCVTKNAMTVVCKVTGYFGGSSEKPAGESKE